MTVLVTMMIMHHAQQVQTLCVVWKPRVKQAHSCVQQVSPFFMFGSASDTERDIASLTRALTSTSKVLHCSVWSREGPWVIAASQPMRPGVYPYLASSTEFLMCTRIGLAGSVLIGEGKSLSTGRTSIRNGCSLGSLGSYGSSSGNNLLGVPRMLLKKTRSAASSRRRLLTVLHTSQPAGFPTMNSSEPSLMPNNIPS